MSASPEAPASRRFIGAWLVIALAGVAIMLPGGGYLALTSFEAKILIQILAAVILGTWLAVAAIRPSWRPASPLLAPVLIAMAAYVVSWSFSQRPRLSLEPGIGGLGFALAFLFLSRLLQEPWFRRRAASLLVSVVVFVTVTYVAQVLLEWWSWWGLVGRLAAPPLRPLWAGSLFGTPNLVATFLLLAGPLAVAIVSGLGATKTPAIILAFLVLIAVFLTGARSAYLAVGVGMLAASALVAARLNLKRLLQVGLAALRRSPKAIVIAGVALLTAAPMVPAVIHRLGQGGEDIRFDLWRSALRIFAEFPITGTGPGTWVQLKTLYNPADVPNPTFSNAHNLYLQTAAELGIVGVIALAVLTFLVLRRLHAAWDRGSAPTQRASLAALAGLAAFATMAVFDTLTNMPMVCLLVIGLVAWVDSALGHELHEGTPRWQSRIERAGSRRILPAVALAGVALAVPTVIRTDIAWYGYLQGNSSALKGAWVEALAMYQNARRWDPDFTLYQLQEASALARLGQLEPARDLLRVAVSVDPVAINQIGLAVLELELGDDAKALAAARQAVRLGFDDTTIALNAGLVAERAGDLRFALEQYASAIRSNPALARSPFWDAPERLVTRSSVLDTALALAGDTTDGLILAHGGRSSDAIALLERLPKTQLRDICLAVAIWQDGRPAEAIGRLKAMLDENPLDWVVAAWTSRIARLSGDLEGSSRFGLWAMIVQADSAPAVIVEFGEIPAEGESGYLGLPRSYPAGVYSRSTGPFLPMPYLVLIGGR